MSKKITTVVLIVLTVCISLFIYYLFQSVNEDSKLELNTNVTPHNTSEPNTSSSEKSLENKVAIEVRDDKVFLNIDAYHESCSMDIQPIVSIFENDDWITVKEKLPHATSYYVDEEYHEYDGPFPMCDLLAHWKIKSPVEIALPKFTYEKVADIVDPKNKDEYIEKYVTEKYSGDFKIDLTYCTDGTCRTKEVFTAILNKDAEILSTKTTAVQNP